MLIAYASTNVHQICIASTLMGKKLVRLNLNITEEEAAALEQYADKDGRTKTEVVREKLRELPTYDPEKKPKNPGDPQAKT
jgi:hypothetical protein